MTQLKEKNLFALLLLLIVVDGFAQEKQDPWLYNFKVKLELEKEELVDFWDRASQRMVGVDKVDRNMYFAKVDSAFNTYKEDSITLTEMVKLYRGAVDLFTNEDPHFRIYPSLIRNANHKEASRKNFQKVIKALPFSCLQINDSLLVDESINENILKGDLILSINGIKTVDLLNYTYSDRYINSSLMQLQYHMMFTPDYDLELIRDGKMIKTNVVGATLEQYNKQLSCKETITMVSENIGYIEIKEFQKNKTIIKKLRKLIKQVKQSNGHSIIIDLRRNPGGSGEDFDKLVSIFTPREKIDYHKSIKVMISEKTIPHYGYADSIGKLVTLPFSDPQVYYEVPLQPDLYMGKMNYYILMSINTGSMASSFANIIQYNNLGSLVGEPMRYNATKYGEVEQGNDPLAAIQLFYSTIEIDEYTKAKDGVIRPDISIPYIATEYMKGSDPMLEKLFQIIKSKND
ncbi:MAG: S41 family peptidase [Bacteroidales bacterium]|nr:S41 family peptidase [Bacteroidales bacterium]